MRPEPNPTPQATSPGPEAPLRIPCEVYSRIVGYLRPVQNWNQGKRQEFRERRPFHSPAAGEAEGPQ